MTPERITFIVAIVVGFVVGIFAIVIVLYLARPNAAYDHEEET